MDKPAIAVAGAGYWGKNIVRSLNELGSLSCICDSREDLLDGYRDSCPGVRLTTDYKSVLEDKDIQGVAIASPAAMHTRMVEDALMAGKDVFVEKPLCLSEKEGRGLIELAREKERVLMVGHLLQYHYAVTKLKDMLNSGELGKIFYIYSTRLNLGKVRNEENCLWSFAPHDISVVLALTKEMPHEVSAHAGCFLQGGVADNAMSSMTFPSGAKAHIFVSWLHPFKEQKLVVVGSKKMVVFNDVEAEDKLMVYPHKIGWKGNLPVPEKSGGVPVKLVKSEPLKAEMAHFIECMMERRKPLTDGEEGLNTLKVLQACQESLEQNGKAVSASKAGLPYFVHPTSFVDPPAKVGEGTSIWHFSHVMRESEIGRGCNIGQNVVISPGVRIGDMVKIQNNVSVYSGVTLEDGVFCGPSMVFTNVINPRSMVSRKDEYRATLVKRGASLGANCTVVCGNTIGRYAFVGAGSVVTRDVPDYALVSGNPARVTGYMCECGVKLIFKGDGAACKACGTRFSKKDDMVTKEA